MGPQWLLRTSGLGRFYLFSTGTISKRPDPGVEVSVEIGMAWISLFALLPFWSEWMHVKWNKDSLFFEIYFRNDYRRAVGANRSALFGVSWEFSSKYAVTRYPNLSLPKPTHSGTETSQEWVYSRVLLDLKNSTQWESAVTNHSKKEAQAELCLLERIEMLVIDVEKTTTKNHSVFLK